MSETFYDRLLVETQELAIKTNKLNDFMRTQKFVDLDRENKDLLYSQSRLMNEYLQILGKRLELLNKCYFVTLLLFLPTSDILGLVFLFGILLFFVLSL